MLSDIGHDHRLDREEFVIALFLINSKLKNKIKEIPATLPQSLLQKGTSLSKSSPAADSTVVEPVRKTVLC